MKSDNKGFSALAAAATRVIESYRPEEERLFDDRFATYFLPLFWQGIIRLLHLTPGLGQALLAMRERQYPGVIGNLLCRTRFIDDTLRDALKGSLDQVVILGAGFDSRAYRIQGIERTHVFEVDHPTTQAQKQECLQQIFGTLPSHVTFVPIDFNKQKLEDTMTAAGFRAGRRTFFIWEGVTQYITAEAVDAIFRYVSRNGAPGSRIVFTYIHSGIIDGSARSEVDQKIVSLAQHYGVPWIFGIDPAEIAQYLAVRGLELVEDAGASEYQARYLDPIGRQMNVFKEERVALARMA